MPSNRAPQDDGVERGMGAFVNADATAADTPCPDENALVALASGTLLDAERGPVEQHAAACRACRASVAVAVRALQADSLPSVTAPPAPAPAAVSRRPRLWRALAAAVVLLAIGAAAATWMRSGGPAGDRSLEDHVAALARSHPALFAEFTLLTPDERLERRDVLERGARRLRTPAGTVLETRPAVAWHTGAGEDALVVVSTDAGIEVERADEVASPWRPGVDLQRGRRYMVELEVEGVLGPERESRAFGVASAETLERYRARRETVEAQVPPAMRDLLLAQLALEDDLLLEARRRAEAHLMRAPQDRVGREVLFQALHSAGDPDAEDVLKGP